MAVYKIHNDHFIQLYDKPNPTGAHLKQLHCPLTWETIIMSKIIDINKINILVLYFIFLELIVNLLDLILNKGYLNSNFSASCHLTVRFMH